MYSLENYGGLPLQVVTPDPAGDGGSALNSNFKTLSDALAGKLPLSGGTLSGTLNLGGHSLNLNSGAGTGGGSLNLDGGSLVDGSSTLYYAGSLYAGRLSSAPPSPVGGQLYFNTTSNRFQGYNGSAWTALNSVTGNTGSASLGTTYSATTSWNSTGLSVVLPNAGTYLVTLVARCYNNAANAYLSLRLYNSTDAAAVSNSTILGPISSATGTFQSTTTAALLVTTSGAGRTIQLQALQQSGSGSSVIHTDTSGGTYLSYIQLA